MSECKRQYQRTEALKLDACFRVIDDIEIWTLKIKVHRPKL